MIHPAEHHWTIFQQMLRGGAATTNLVTDAHLATLAVEHNCVLQYIYRDSRGFVDQSGKILLRKNNRGLDLLSAVSLLKFPRARFRRHLEKSQFAAPLVFDRRAVRD